MQLLLITLMLLLMALMTMQGLWQRTMLKQRASGKNYQVTLRRGFQGGLGSLAASRGIAMK